MSIAWSEITAAEIAVGVKPTSILAQKLVNNPRAVMYGDATVPYAERILADNCLSPTTGALNDFILSDGNGGVTLGVPAFSSLMNGAVYQPLVDTLYTPFPVAGVYTIMLWGNGGPGGSSLSGSVGMPGGSGGFAKAYVNALPSTEIEIKGFVLGNASFVRETSDAWRLDATPGQQGGLTGFAGGESGVGSITGFARGYGLAGATFLQFYSLAAGHVLGGTVEYGKGGKYNTNGQLGAVFIARGVH